MRRFFLCLCTLFFAHSAAQAAPKLIVIVVGDQIRADYLERFHDELASDGLRRFRDEGTYYTHALQDHGVTKTSPGHTLIGSGIYGKDSGIVGNEWYDVASSRTVSAAELIPGGKRTQLRWFMGTSFAQRLHQTCPNCRDISLSYKDRGALLLTGPDQDEAYWCDEKTKFWTSYHGTPPWLASYNGKPTKVEAADAATEALAEEIIRRDRLGQHPKETDVFTVSFSAVDLIGHDHGPDSAEVKAAFLNLDRQVARLMKTVEQSVGKEVVWVFSSDHGVTPLPETSKAQGLPAGRVSLRRLHVLHPKWIKAVSQPFIYMSSEEAIGPLKGEIEKMEGVQAVYTKQEIASGQAPIEVTRDYYPSRCGDLWVVLKPKYIFSDLPTGTTHGQPTDDDERVPMGFYGPGFPPSVHGEKSSVSSITPTLYNLTSRR